VASPALQAPVLRAPQVYQDDTVQALTEFANNFAQGFAKLKQVETQQDIILGEQMFLEQQPEFEGLFDSASPSLDSEGKFVRAKEIAEETSLGARIGFDRAAGRMLAAREREVIDQAIQKAIVEGSAPDPTTGIPGNPSLFSADGAIAQARKEFRDSVSKSSSNWVLSSPYAQEEYTSNMARLLPEAINKGRSELLKVKQDKFREQLMEQTSAKINEEMGKYFANTQTLEQTYANIGGFVKNNAVRGGIANPREFLVQASFNAARSAISSQNMPNGTAQIDTSRALRTYELMGRYTTDGASLTGGEVGTLYYRLGNNLQTELASIAKQQDPNDRLKLSIDAFRTGKLAVAVDKDNNIVTRSSDGKAPEGGRLMPLREYLEEQRRTGGLDAVNNALAIWQGKLNPNIDGSVYADGAAIAKAARDDFSVSPDSPNDMFAMAKFKNALTGGDFTTAREQLGNIRGAQARGEANKLFDAFTSAESKLILEDPIYKREAAPLEKPDAFILSELDKLGITDVVSDADKAALFERAQQARDSSLVVIRDALKLPPNERLKVSLDAVKAIREDLKTQVSTLASGPATFVKRINEIQAGSGQQAPRSAANEIIAEFNAGRLSASAYQRLLAQDTDKMQWQTALNKVDLNDLAQKAVRTSALTNFGIAENTYLVSGGPAGQRELSIAGIEAAKGVSDRVKGRLDEYIKANLPIIRGPGADKILENLARNYTLEEIKKDGNLNSKSAMFSASRKNITSGKPLTAQGSRVAIIKGYAGIGTQYGLSGQPLGAGQKLTVDDVAFGRDQESSFGNPAEDASPFKTDEYGIPLPQSANTAQIGTTFAAKPTDFSDKNAKALGDALNKDDQFRTVAPFQMNYTEALANKIEGADDPAIFHHQGLVWAQKIGFSNWSNLDASTDKKSIDEANKWIKFANKKRTGLEQEYAAAALDNPTKERALSSLRVHTGLSPEEWQAGAYIVKTKTGEVRVPITNWGLLNFSMAPIIPGEILSSPQASAAWARVGITDPGLISVLTVKQANLGYRNDVWGIK